MKGSLCWLAISLIFASAAHASQTEAIALAAKDAAKLGDVAKEARYLWLTGTAKEKQQMWQVLSVHCNSLSREPDIVRPAVILSSGASSDGFALGAGWKDATLIRLVLDDYGWPAKEWERLAEQDFFFHVTLIQETVVEVDAYWPGGVWEVRDGGDGKNYAAGPYKKRVKKKAAKTPALAPWLSVDGDGRRNLASLVASTGSACPILRADNFLWQTAIQAERTVGYYGLQGIKDRDTFRKLVGFNEKESKEFTRELLASVANSGVARQARRIARFEKLGGSYWTTFDNKTATDDRNPLRVLNGGFKHDAEEVFAHGANGLFKLGLFAANGDRQDSAPDIVGFDRTTHNNDGRIHVGLSCWRCHQMDKASDGLNSIKDWSRNLFKLPLALSSADYKTLRKLRSQYLRRLEPFLDVDRKRHADAVKECSGLTTQAWAKAFGDAYAEYDSPVTLAKAAAELETTEEVFLKALEAYTRVSGQTDTVLGMYLRPRDEQEPIPRDTWHEEYVVARSILAGAKPVK